MPPKKRLVTKGKKPARTKTQELCLYFLVNMPKLEKSINIKEDKRGEASSYGNLGTVFQSVGEYEKAKECLEEALVTRIQIGHKEGEAKDYRDLETVFQSVD